MPAIVVKAFGGMRPIVERQLLDAAEADLARNLKLTSGGLVPLRGSTTLKALTLIAPQTIWRYGNAPAEGDWWFEFAGDVDIIRSPIANDPHGRVYWTDGVQPRYGPTAIVLSGSGTLPGGSLNLGIPAPTAPPTITFTPGTPPNAESRSYVYTYVSTYGEEGPPSPPSAPVTVDPTAVVNVTAMQVGPGGPISLATKRIYRTSTVGSTAQFQFVAEVALATVDYADVISQATLGEVLPSEEWVAPPNALRGLKFLANGAAIGFVGNTIHLSEPNLPHAWPHEVPIDVPIVGIGVFRQGAVALTNGHPYVITGADPAAMSAERLELPQACLSKLSIVDTGDGTLFASTDGLVSIGPGGMDVVTRKLLSREQWQAYNPASMRGAFIDGKYHAFYTTAGGLRGVLIFDFEGQGGAMSVSDFNAVTAVTAAYADPRSDTLYLAQGTNIVRWDRGSSLTFVWRSGTYRLAAPANMACAALDAEAYPVTVRVYADGNLILTKTVTDRGAWRLPAGFEAYDWSFEVEGAAKVTRFAMATSISELKAAQ